MVQYRHVLTRRHKYPPKYYCARYLRIIIPPGMQVSHIPRVSLLLCLLLLFVFSFFFLKFIPPHRLAARLSRVSRRDIFGLAPDSR